MKRRTEFKKLRERENQKTLIALILRERDAQLRGIERVFIGKKRKKGDIYCPYAYKTINESFACTLNFFFTY